MKNKIMKKFMLSLSMLIAFSSSNFSFCAEKKEPCNIPTIAIVAGMAIAMATILAGLIGAVHQEA